MANCQNISFVSSSFRIGDFYVRFIFIVKFLRAMMMYSGNCIYETGRDNNYYV